MVWMNQSDPVFLWWHTLGDAEEAEFDDGTPALKKDPATKKAAAAGQLHYNDLLQLRTYKW